MAVKWQILLLTQYNNRISSSVNVDNVTLAQAMVKLIARASSTGRTGCNICPLDYKNDANLKKHMERKHGPTVKVVPPSALLRPKRLLPVHPKPPAPPIPPIPPIPKSSPLLQNDDQTMLSQQQGDGFTIETHLQWDTSQLNTPPLYTPTQDTPPSEEHIQLDTLPVRHTKAGHTYQ